VPDWAIAIVLGIVEGITEFLPISSTGHLLLAEHLLKAPQSDLFNTVIQSGAVLAVMLIFTDRLRQLLFQWREPETREYVLKLGVAFFITGVGGLALKKLGFTLPETPGPVAWATLIGGVLFLVVESRPRAAGASDRITWTVAVAIGVAQLLAAVFPGLSRSGSTILMALVLGVSRPAAVEFTFLLGIPTLVAAGGLELVSALRDPQAGPIEWSSILLGGASAAVTAFAAVRWLIRYVQTHTFAAFGWYRIVLGAGILLLA
jgi:undecaprenyl-diphosphatase